MVCDCIQSSRPALADILAAFDPATRSTEKFMGKGDLRSRRGKIYNGSYGKTRPGRAPKKKEEGAAKTAAPRTRK
jgi:30S ribosomal protein S31